MDNSNLSTAIELIVNYLNNIINLNILLVTVGLVLIYWIHTQKNLKETHV